MPLVTVIIISFNSGVDRLEKAVQSVLKQDFEDFELLVFDNASTDGAPGQLKASPKLSLHLNKENLGFSGGMNAAAKIAGGKWIALLNPDAVAMPDWLSNFAAATQTYPDVCSFASVQLDASDGQKLDGLGDVYHPSGIAWRGGFGKSIQFKPDENRLVFSACGAGAFYHRPTFLELGGFGKDFFCYHEDVDLGARLQLAGRDCLLLHNAVIQHEGSAITGRYSDFTIFHGARNRFYSFVRVMPPLIFWLFLPVHFSVHLLFLLRGLWTGNWRAYGRGFIAGLRHWQLLWAQRQEIQRKRRLNSLQFSGRLCWSPLKLLRRLPHLRQLKAVSDPFQDKSRS